MPCKINGNGKQLGNKMLIFQSHLLKKQLKSVCSLKQLLCQVIKPDAVLTSSSVALGHSDLACWLSKGSAC